MAVLTVGSVTRTGAATALVAAAAGGDTFANDGRTFIHVKNGGASPITVTVPAVSRCSQGQLHDVAVSVTNGTEKRIGPFPPSIYNNPTTGIASITYSAVTTVTVEAVSLSAN